MLSEKAQKEIDIALAMTHLKRGVWPRDLRMWPEVGLTFKFVSCLEDSGEFRNQKGDTLLCGTEKTKGKYLIYTEPFLMQEMEWSVENLREIMWHENSYHGGIITEENGGILMEENEKLIGIEWLFLELADEYEIIRKERFFEDHDAQQNGKEKTKYYIWGELPHG